MDYRGDAILCAMRSHGETGAIVRLLTAERGLIAGYVHGARGRDLRPVLIPGNRVLAELRARLPGQLPTARLELQRSVGPWLNEPLANAAISWVTVLAASVLPEGQPYPRLAMALGALTDAICLSDRARDWVQPLLSYETLMLRELGYGAGAFDSNLPVAARFQAIGREIDQHLLGGRVARNGSDVMAARALLMRRLAPMVEDEGNR